MSVKLKFGLIITVALSVYAAMFVLELVGWQVVAEWSRYLGLFYVAPLALLITLVTKTDDLGEVSSIHHRKLEKLRVISRAKIKAIWALIVFQFLSLLFTLVFSVLGTISTNGRAIPAYIGYFGASLVVVTLAVAAYALIIVLPVMYFELRDFRWQVLVESKRESQRGEYVSQMREEAKSGFNVDEQTDGSKRTRH